MSLFIIDISSILSSIACWLWVTKMDNVFFLMASDFTVPPNRKWRVTNMQKKTNLTTNRIRCLMACLNVPSTNTTPKLSQQNSNFSSKSTETFETKNVRYFHANIPLCLYQRRSDHYLCTFI